MADLSRLNDKIGTLAAKVDDLIVKSSAPPVTAPDNQPEVDAAEARIDAILARIP